MMPIKFYNYLFHKKQILKPIKKGFVSIYSCGPTVYNFVHLGNLRTYIFSDVLCRVLRYNGFKVKQVMNITDVDDKIIKSIQSASLPVNLPWSEKIKVFTDKYANAFIADIKSLNIAKPFLLPRATKNISYMIKIIGILLKKKYAYVAADGIYFDIKKFSNYGKLSGLKKRQIKIGARVNVDEYQKDNASDFALWKFRRIDSALGISADEPVWRSPWGNGRPGWHIECSAMTFKYLGQPFDIHTGAIDLLFPHHENEIAQSEAAFPRKFVNYFLEGAHLLVDNKKMAKSLGNILVLEDIRRKGLDLISFRYLCLLSHYRSQMNFTWEALGAADKSLARLKKEVVNLAIVGRNINNIFKAGILVDNIGIKKNKKSLLSHSAKSIIKRHEVDFLRYINDDLGMPQALAQIFRVLSDKDISANDKLRLILKFDRVLGLGLEYYYKIGVENSKEIKKLKPMIKKREIFRREKRFKEADEIRNEIKKRGYDIEDVAGGVLVKFLL